jgi:hypothetical protein
MFQRNDSQDPGRGKLLPEEILFFAGQERERALYVHIRDALLAEFPFLRVDVQKTQISFRDRRLIAMLSLPRRRRKAEERESLLLTVGLRRAAAHPLLEQCVEPYPGRYTHHLHIEDVAQLDASVLELVE